MKRRSRTRRLATAATMLVTTLVAASCASDGGSAKVVVNGHTVVIASRRWTVLDALNAAGASARGGMFLSAVTGKLLTPNGNAPKLEVDGRNIVPSARVTPGTKIVAANGADSTEPLEAKAGYGDPPPLPPVLRSLWHPGRGAVEQQMVGKLSGEVLSRTPVGPALPPEPETGKVIALSFDDGPDRRYTPAILKILNDEGVKATFCVVGSAARKAPDLVQAEVAFGHTLCNHTMDHAHMTTKSVQDMQSQLAGCNEAVVAAVGRPPTMFRAPYGELSQAVIDVVHGAGLEILQWNIDPSDFNRPAPGTIAARVLAHAEPGAVALMHDGGGDRSNTVKALLPLIRALKAQGYTFTTQADETPVSAAP